MGKCCKSNDSAGQSADLKCHTAGKFACLDGEVAEWSGLTQQGMPLALFLIGKGPFCELAGIDFT